MVRILKIYHKSVIYKEVFLFVVVCKKHGTNLRSYVVVTCEKEKLFEMLEVPKCLKFVSLAAITILLNLWPLSLITHAICQFP